MDATSLAAILTAAVGGVAAIGSIVNGRSQLRVLERVSTVRKNLVRGSAARANVVRLETLLSAKLLTRVSRSTAATLLRWGLISTVVGAIFVVFGWSSYAMLADFRLEPLSIYLIRSSITSAGHFILGIAIGSFVFSAIAKVKEQVSLRMARRRGSIKQVDLAAD